MDTTLTNSSTINSEAGDCAVGGGGCEKTGGKKRRFVSVLIMIVGLLAGIIVIFFADRLLMPKYATSIFEGSLIAEYYSSEKDHQLLIIGDCEVYENISTITLWKDYGITSFIRGSPQQLMWQSYYLLEDALKYETPETVLFSVYAMKYPVPQSEAYNRLTLDGMRFSLSKINSVNASMTDSEDFVSYFLPLLRFHERWKELSSEDFQYLFSKRDVSFSGFTVRSDIMPLGRLPTPVAPGDLEFADVCWEYLEKARLLCESRGIEFVLFKAPVLHPHWFDEWDEQIVAYARTHGLKYINALDVSDDIGLDFSTDTYNGGLHLNVWGAEKMAAYLGEVLTESGSRLGGLRSDLETSLIWDAKAEEYEALKARQLAEIEEFGKVMTLVRG